MSKVLPRHQTSVLGSQLQQLSKTPWVGILLLGLSLAAAAPALAQEQLLKTLAVSGVGVENIEATLANVRLGVEAKGKTAAAAQQEAARRSDAVVKVLRSQNVDKLQTTGINLSPVYETIEKKSQLTGYQARNIVSFQVPATTAGQLLDRAVAAGATRIDSISFTATDTAIEAARLRALRSAAGDAQRKAAVVFDALNITPQGVISIQVSGARALPPRSVGSGFAGTSTPVIGGEQSVSASVTIQIQY